MNDEIVTKLSPRTVAETVARLTSMLTAGGVRIFDVIDQRAEARTVGLDLRATTLVIFGNPAAGTPVMVAAPLSALDLPLKVLVWADGAQTKVSYVAPAAIEARHGLDPSLTANLAAVDLVTDRLIEALVAPPSSEGAARP